MHTLLTRTSLCFAYTENGKHPKLLSVDSSRTQVLIRFKIHKRQSHVTRSIQQLPHLPPRCRRIVANLQLLWSSLCSGAPINVAMYIKNLSLQRPLYHATSAAASFPSSVHGSPSYAPELPCHLLYTSYALLPTLSLSLPPSARFTPR